MARIGFVGLGQMGGGMSRNLMKHGHSLRVFDLSADQVSALVADGAEAATSAAEDRLLCVVCQDGERGVLLVPCGHCVLCAACAHRIAAAIATNRTVTMELVQRPHKPGGGRTIRRRSPSMARSTPPSMLRASWAEVSSL